MDDERESPLLSLTAADASVNSAEQLRLALRTMANQGGVATTQDIYAAVQTAMQSRNPAHRLSKQGRDSLRAIINRDAVRRQLVFPHSERQSAWRITPLGRELVGAFSAGSVVAATMVSPVGRDFHLAIQDVYTLLAAEHGASQTSAVTQAFLRAGVIMTVTAWETFVEDTVIRAVHHRIDAATSPTDLGNTFAEIARTWILGFGDKRPTPADLISWTGSGWKQQILGHFQKEIRSFNTPSSKNIRTLTQRYLRRDMTEDWHWSGSTPTVARGQLDTLISLRGDLVHRGRTHAAPELPIDRRAVLEMIALVEQLAWTTDVHWNADDIEALGAHATFPPS